MNTPAPRSENFIIPGPQGAIPVRLYAAENQHQPLPLVLYFHGGGFNSGSLEDAEIPASFIAQHCPAVVVSVDYALAPLHPFPAAPEDAYAAAQWAVRNAVRLHAVADLLIVAGDDAGGSIATSLSMMARDRREFKITAQVLIVPMLDPSMTLLDDAARIKSDLTSAQCAQRYQQYLPHCMQRLHPYAAPLESLRLAGLPPAMIATAECDVLHAEAEKYASALIKAGIPTQFSRFAGVKHAELHTHVPVLREIVDFLRRQTKSLFTIFSSGTLSRQGR
ncbi:alpha/beta hydrolase [Methylobacillus arboreus]|uniref:alpha/beta hydrolase n=1 Tax=Methylobacillus arboreus TaxID=755170 RepID=UPI001E5FD3F1|nr:alpha/beta hydrolase [Methylobacillus arboreus]MCB5189474.1 alpha/beta hydrolase [Methylobacillus arboreus]